MKSWIWPFSRRRTPAPPPIIDRREDNEGWQVGDLAECISDRWRTICPSNPRVGDILRVSQVGEGVAIEVPVLMVWLAFEGRPLGYQCTAFRKLRPVQEPASDEFKADLKDRLRKPARVDV